MSALLVKSIRTYNTVDLFIWCRKFHLMGARHPNVDKRFAIGFYQIYQALKWGNSHNNPNAQESYMACAIHLICVLAFLDIDVFKRFGSDLRKINYNPNIDERELLLNLAHAQQMLVYLWATSSSRKSRYESKIVGECLTYVIKTCIGCVPKNRREYAIQDATEIMSGSL